MIFDPLKGLLGANPIDWWRSADDMWRWGVKVSDIWAYDAADDETRALIRARRLAGLLAHARRESPFYRRLHGSVPEGSPLSELPPVSRSVLMQNFDDWVTDREIRLDDVLEFIADPDRAGQPFLGRYGVWTSSGTTGVAGIYLQDADALALYAALMTTRFPFGSEMADPYQVISGRARSAFVAALGGHFAGVVSWERQRRLHPALARNTRSFSILQPLPELVAQLNDWQPAFLATYPTMLVLLAREQAEGRLRLSPRALWCGGEGLTDSDRAHLEEAFGCTVVEDYGASEAMNMAFACSRGRLHLNDDWFVLEPVDEQHQPVPPGEASVTVLVTNLANRVQPMIRYDLADSVTVDPHRCTCGDRRPVVRIEGRRDDVLALRARDGGVVRILPLAIETVLEEEAQVLRFQLLQSAPDALSLRLDLPQGDVCEQAFGRCQQVLSKFLLEQGCCHRVAVTFDPQTPEMNPVSGKLRQVRVLKGAHSEL